MLYTISNSSADIAFITCDDAVLFWQNGVVITLKGNQLLEAVLSKTTQCFVLDNDIIARGLSERVDLRVKIVSMQEVITLTVNHHPQIAL